MAYRFFFLRHAVPTRKVARRQARSREQEEAFLRGVNASVEESASNPWARVCDLVDLKASVLPASSSARGGSGSRSGSRRSSAAAAGIEGDDAFRATEKMRSLIIQVGKERGVCCFSRFV